jgi:pyridoxine 5-phosphate synthase
MLRLGVNIDHVATVRQARLGQHPDPVTAAALAIIGGASGITVHLREDRRHIQERDVRLVRQTTTGCLNLEMAAVDEMARFASEVKPDEVTLVPEKRQELTTEGGLDLIAHEKAVRDITSRLKDAGILVSLFIDPNARQVEAAHRIKAHAIELQTGTYSESKKRDERKSRLVELAEAALLAHQLGLKVHAGHGLDYQNVQPVAAIPQIEELNIGHSIVSRAILVGMEQAVRQMCQAMDQGRCGGNWERFI